MKKVISLLLVTALFVSMCAILCGCDSGSSGNHNNVGNNNYNSNNVNNNSSSNGNSGNNNNDNGNNDNSNSNGSNESNSNNGYDFNGLRITLDSTFQKLSENHSGNRSAMTFKSQKYDLSIEYGPIEFGTAQELADQFYAQSVASSPQGFFYSQGTFNGTPYMCGGAHEEGPTGAYSFYVKDGMAWIAIITIRGANYGDSREMTQIITGWKFT